MNDNKTKELEKNLEMNLALTITNVGMVVRYIKNDIPTNDSLHY